MHGLAVLQHDVVGDINDVVDGADAVCSQAAAQPLGGGADLDVGDHTGGVTVAQILSGDLNVQLLEDAACIGALDNGLVVVHGLAEGGSGLTGQADDGVAVGTVVGDLEVNDGVVVADDLVDVLADGAGLIVQDPDAIEDGVGEVAQGQTQLFQAAEHAVGLDAAQLALGDVDAAGQPGVVHGHGDHVALLDILCAGDDLDGLVLADVDLADPHVVGVLVADDLGDLADDDVLDLSVHTLPGLDLLAEDGQGVDIFLIGNVAQVHKFGIDPFSVEFH